MKVRLMSWTRDPSLLRMGNNSRQVLCTSVTKQYNLASVKSGCYTDIAHEALASYLWSSNFSWCLAEGCKYRGPMGVWARKGISIVDFFSASLAFRGGIDCSLYNSELYLNYCANKADCSFYLFFCYINGSV